MPLFDNWLYCHCMKWWKAALFASHTRRQLRAFNWTAMTWFLFIVHSSMNYLVFVYYHSNPARAMSEKQGTCSVLRFIDFLSDAVLCALFIRTHINVIAFMIDCSEFFMKNFYWVGVMNVCWKFMDSKGVDNF